MFHHQIKECFPSQKLQILYKFGYSSPFHQDTFKVKQFAGCDRIEMILSIEVTNMFDKDDNLIDKSDWHKYGVIDTV